MTTFTVLNNFPKDLLLKVKAVWHAGIWENIIKVNPGVMHHYWLHTEHELFNFFPKESLTLEYYLNPPHVFNAVHLDRGRFSALNIPVQVDTNNSFFGIGKTDDLSYYTRKEGVFTFETSEKGEKGFFTYEKHKMLHYNLEKPVLFNTKVPHGLVNNADTERILLSVTFSKTYNEMKDILKDWL